MIMVLFVNIIKWSFFLSFRDVISIKSLKFSIVKPSLIKVAQTNLRFS